MVRFVRGFAITFGCSAVALAAACGSDAGGGEEGLAPDAGTTAADATASSSSSSGGSSGGGSSSGGSSSGGPTDAGADADPPVKLGATGIAAGGDGACAIVAGGALRCWGAGNGEPANVVGGGSFLDVEVGGYGSNTQVCAVRSDNSLLCWTLRTNTPAQRDTGSFTRTTVGGSHGCAVATNGRLYCWGYNSSGQLGNGTTSSFEANLVAVGADTDWAMATAGADHTCALKKTGALFCWGGNGQGQIGDDGGTSQDGGVALQSAPVAIEPATTWKDVSAGSYATCGVKGDGTLHCWGSGVGKNVKVPTSVDTASDWAQVSVSSTHACARKTTGKIYCWGTNTLGALGTGDLVARPSPSQVGTDADWTAVATGESFSCATKADGTARCWGAQGQGQLGAGDVGHLLPKKIGAGADFKDVDLAGNVTCGVKKTGANLTCWGATSTLAGQTAPARAQVPVTIGADTDWSAVTVGSSNACARKSNDALFCWGQNYNGAAGIGPTPSVAYAPTATGLVATAVDHNGDHGCAIDGAGAFYCWGSDTFDQIGGGNDANVPTKVGSDTWIAVATGWYSSCGIRTDGTLWCMGFGFSDPMEKITNDTNWTAVANAPGREDFMAIKGGALYTFSWIDSATQVGTETDWKSIAVGGGHWCAIRTDGTLACAGSNSSGQLGDGTTTSHQSAATVGAANDWVDVSAGSSHTCGIRGAGDLFCWGSNASGEIGDGTAWSATPLAVK